VDETASSGSFAHPSLALRTEFISQAIEHFELAVGTLVGISSVINYWILPLFTSLYQLSCLPDEMTQGFKGS